MRVSVCKGKGRSSTKYYMLSRHHLSSANSGCSNPIRKGWGAGVTPGSFCKDCCSSLCRQLPFFSKLREDFVPFGSLSSEGSLTTCTQMSKLTNPSMFIKHLHAEILALLIHE